MLNTGHAYPLFGSSKQGICLGQKSDLTWPVGCGRVMTGRNRIRSEERNGLKPNGNV